MGAVFNKRLRQIVLLMFIAFLVIALLRQLYVFLPGFLGLIFGPLLISYFIILVKIYINEFAATPIAAEQPFKD